MPTPDPRAAHVRDAIALVTAWLADPDGGPLVGETAAGIVDERSPDDPVAGLTHLVGGLTNLCGGLLFRLEKHTGVPAATTLQDYGQRFAAE